MKDVRVIIVDDHQIFIQGLRIIIESYDRFAVVGEAANVSQAETLVEEQKPDIAIIDLNLGSEDGLELIRQLKKKHSGLLMIVLSMLDEKHYAERALNAGARAFIMKEETADVLYAAMCDVLDGKVWLSEKQRDRYLESLFTSGMRRDSSKDTVIQSLSNRQLSILRLMGKGHKTAGIAEELAISPKTVEAHKTQLKRKLGCRTAQELLRFAIEWTNR